MKENLTGPFQAPFTPPPAQKLDPPGEGDVGALSERLKQMVTGVGQVGCGYEAQLESVRGEETIGAYAGVIATGDVAFELRLDGAGLPARLRLEMTSVNAGPLTSETAYRDWRDGEGVDG